MDYITKLVFKPLEALINSLFAPIGDKFTNTMFTMDNPFLSEAFVRKYNFILHQSEKMMWALVVYALVVTFFSFEKRRYLSFLVETLIGIVLLYGNSALVFFVNFIFNNMSKGIAGSVIEDIYQYFIGDLSAAIIASLNPGNLLLGAALAIMFVLLFIGLDILQMAIQIFVLISPLLICMYPFKSLRSYTQLFYKTYISINLAIIFVGAVFFVAMLNVAPTDLFGRISVGLSSILLCIVVAPMILFKAIGTVSKGVE